MLSVLPTTPKLSAGLERRGKLDKKQTGSSRITLLFRTCVRSTLLGISTGQSCLETDSQSCQQIQQW